MMRRGVEKEEEEKKQSGFTPIVEEPKSKQ